MKQRELARVEREIPFVTYRATVCGYVIVNNTTKECAELFARNVNRAISAHVAAEVKADRDKRKKVRK
jgi:hypothetical protein